MLIANMEPLVVLYFDGFLRVSLTEYDLSSKDPLAHLTNTHLAQNSLEDNDELTDEDRHEAMNEQMWNYERFQQHMIDIGKVKDDTWLDDYVRPTMKRSMLHLTRMHYEKFMRHPGVCELLGVDYMFDDDLNLWYLEVARSPAMAATTREKGELQTQLLQDIIEVNYCLINPDCNFEETVEASGFEFVYNGFKTGMDRYYGFLEPDCV
jgi:hypothetical protein